MQSELRFFYFIRSGSHAIIHWICINQERYIVYYDNICLHKNSITKHNPVNKPNQIYLYEEKFKIIKSNNYNSKNFRQFEKEGCLTVKGFENPSISPKDDDFVILRDPYNWIASVLRLKTFPRLNINSLHRKDFQSIITHYIKLCEHQNQILFNLWFTSLEYRKKLQTIFNLTSRNKDINRVHHMGGFSSFDKDKFQNKAQEMNVLFRYKNYETNKEYIKLFKSRPKLVEIGKSLFNMNPLNL